MKLKVKNTCTCILYGNERNYNKNERQIGNDLNIPEQDPET